MGISDIIAIVASIITIFAFMFSVWQNVKLRAAEQALQSIRNISQVAYMEADQLQRMAKTEEERAHYRILAAFLVSIINAILAFLKISRRQMSEPGDKDQAFLHMSDTNEETSSANENSSVQ